MKEDLLQQGAEAKIYLKDKKSTILKSRTSKSYRHPTLDKQIRTRRTRREAKILKKALSLNINVPKIISQEKFDLEIKYINGDKLSQTLNSYSEKLQSKIMQQLGKQTALLHTNNIIHGDLTTSNTILQTSNQPPQITKSRNSTRETPADQKITERSSTKPSQIPKIFIIDFGLGFFSSKQEDKAVDLHLIKQALEAKHYQNHEELFNNLLKGYKWKDSRKIINRLKIVERRGRHK